MSIYSEEISLQAACTEKEKQNEIFFYKYNIKFHFSIWINTTFFGLQQRNGLLNIR